MLREVQDQNLRITQSHEGHMSLPLLGGSLLTSGWAPLSCWPLTGWQAELGRIPGDTQLTAYREGDCMQKSKLLVIPSPSSRPHMH